MQIIFLAIVLAAIILLSYIRFAPSDAARWHNADLSGADETPMQSFVAEEGGARFVGEVPFDTPKTALEALDRIALATPRTARIAGSAEDGRITYVTRSKLMGFPDYTTVSAQHDGRVTLLSVYARLRFGRSDFGVNAARLRGWLAGLQGGAG